MSNCSNNYNDQRGNKRPSDSKNCNSFEPHFIRNNEQETKKKQKLQPAITAINSESVENNKSSNRVGGIHSVSGGNHKLRSGFNDDLFSEYGIKCNRSSSDSEEAQVNSEIDETWFQSNVGAVLETCTQVEAEIGIEVPQVQNQINNVSSDSVASNTVFLLQNNMKLQHLDWPKPCSITNQKDSKDTSLHRTASGRAFNNAHYSQFGNSSCSSRPAENNSSSTYENEDIKRLSMEIEVLKEKNRTKDGEIKMLRLKTVETIEKLKSDSKWTEVLWQNKIDSLEKELSKTKGELQFKEMELIVAENKRENQSSIFNSIKKENNVTQTDDLSMDIMLDFIIDKTQACQLVSPEILLTSKAEPIALDPPLHSSNPSAKDSMRKGSGARKGKDLNTEEGHSVSTTCTTLEGCYAALIKLNKMIDFSNNQSHELCLQVVVQSVLIFEELLLRLKSASLREHFVDREKEIYESWQTYLPLNKSYNLLDSGPWYDQEKGIEARRCLGLLSVLIQQSSFVMFIVLPTFDTSVYKQDGTNTPGSFKRLIDSGAIDGQIDKTRMILYTIRDIISEIGNQRRTLSFEGFVTGVVQLIIHLAENKVQLPTDSQEIVLDILQKVIFSRPGGTVLLKVLEFLKAAFRYPFITNKLCCNTAQKNCVGNYWKIILTADTCILQMLCFMLRQLPEDSRYKLADTFIEWLNPLFVNWENSPQWLFLPPDVTNCHCRSLVSQLSITLLEDVCEKYEKGKIRDKENLKSVLESGVFLVHSLVYKDDYFSINIGDSRGHLDLFIKTMIKFNAEVKFQPVTGKLLTKLNEDEILQETSDFTVESKEMSDIMSSLYENSK